MSFEKRKYLSTGFIDNLESEQFVIAGEAFSKQSMMDKLGCGNFLAAARTTIILKKLGIDSAGKLRQMDPMSLFRKKGFGEACMYVCMCFLDYKEYSVAKWWGWTEDHKVVKFSTFRARALNRAKKRVA